MSTPLPDLDGLTPDQLLALVEAANQRWYQLQAEAATTEEQLRAVIGGLEQTVVDLIGDGSGPDDSNIVGIQQFSDAQLDEYRVVALRRIFAGLEIASRTLLALIRVVGTGSSQPDQGQ